MNPHFFTAPFCFAFIWFRVQGSGGGFAAFFRRWYSRIAAFPSRGRCPAGADRVTMVWKTSEIKFPGHSYERHKSPRQNESENETTVISQPLLRESAAAGDGRKNTGKILSA